MHSEHISGINCRKTDNFRLSLTSKKKSFYCEKKITTNSLQMRKQIVILSYRPHTDTKYTYLLYFLSREEFSDY